MMEMFVSPAGNDANSGTLERPVKSLGSALMKVRHGGGGTLWLRGGTYALAETLEITAADSGRCDAPLRIAAWRAERPRLIGGVVIPPSAFQPVTDPETRARLLPEALPHVRVADLAALGVGGLECWPDYSRGAAEAMELFFDGEPATVARWPKRDWLKVCQVLDPDSDLRMPGRPEKAGSFTFDHDRAARWNAGEGLWVSGYWAYDWGFDTVRVAALDTAARVIHMAAPSTYGFTLDGQRRYFVQNLLEELSEPGEYYLDVRRARLYFYPPAPIGAESCVLSTCRGPLVALREASHVSLEGLTIEAARGHGVEIRGGSGNRVRGCTVRNVGLDGVSIEGGCGHSVVGCCIAHTGAQGIALFGGDRQTLTPGNHEAVENDIHHFSRLQRTYAPGLHLRGVGLRAAHNELHHAPHTVVQFHGNDLVFEFNEIHHACDETGDVGVIGSGRDWSYRGNLIRCNFIHHVTGLGSVGAAAVYIDDMGSGTTITGNVIYKAQRAFLIGGGRDNIVTNNIAVDIERAVQIDSRGLNWTPFFAEEGGLLRTNLAAVPYTQPPWSTKYPELVRILEDDPAWPKGNVFRNNVLCRNVEMWLAAEVKQICDIRDNWETADDLGFENEAGLDLRLRADSPVFRHVPGFRAIPFERIGRGKCGAGCPCGKKRGPT